MNIAVTSSGLDVVRAVASGRRPGYPPQAVALAGVIVDQLDYLLPRVEAEQGNGSMTAYRIRAIVKDLPFAFGLFEHIGGLDEAATVRASDGASAVDKLTDTIAAICQELAAHKSKFQQHYADQLGQLAAHRQDRAADEPVLDFGLPRAVEAPARRDPQTFTGLTVGVERVLLATFVGIGLGLLLLGLKALTEMSTHPAALGLIGGLR